MITETTTPEQLTDSMHQMIESDPALAARIGQNAHEITRYVLDQDDDLSLDPSQGTNYAIFFCIGAAWAMTYNKDHRDECTSIL